ncbi:hypothetical protein H2200_003223 [Cladophialophora chaetospira]|uniref:DUF8212 domain-containing protein n=1 Tax=Cladophialophora chaetospira TaxID=386627 RepID=A0AA39CMG9_9EURO|nr:hypothetical protein H2200_003223 [Cladophialophora chaetospira]
MPLLYGEEHKAFRRLQEEIIKANDDYTIFAWKWSKTSDFSGPFAPSPDAFNDSFNVVMDEELEHVSEPITINSKGVFLWTQIFKSIGDSPFVFAVLPCKLDDMNQRLAIFVETCSEPLHHYRRIDHERLELIRYEWYSGLSVRKICIRQGHQVKVAPQLLSEVVKKGHTQLVKLMLKEGANPNRSFYEGRSALANAIFNEDEQLVRLLLKHGADPKPNNPYEPAPSTIANETNNMAIKRLLLGQNTGSRDADPQLIIRAAARGLTAHVTFLVRNGADPNQTDLEFRTSLSQAIIHRQLEVARLLLELGADIEQSTNFKGESMLVTASRSGEVSTVDILLNLGACVESRDTTGSTPLIQAVSNQHTAVADRLLQAGADPNAKDQGGRTPLILAAKAGYCHIVTGLIERGANLEDTDEAGNTPLRWAAHGGFQTVINILLEKGTNLEHATKRGVTALMLLARRGMDATAALFIDKGANVNVKDDTGCSALIYAIHARAWNVVDILFMGGADPHPSYRYLPQGEEALARLLRCECSTSPYGGWPGNERTTRFMEILISAGADIHSSDSEGNTALHWAAQSGYENFVLKLLEQGASPTRKNREGKTPSALAHCRLSTKATTALLVHEAERKRKSEVDEDKQQIQKRRKG